MLRWKSVACSSDWTMSASVQPLHKSVVEFIVGSRRGSVGPLGAADDDRFRRVARDWLPLPEQFFERLVGAPLLVVGVGAGGDEKRLSHAPVAVWRHPLPDVASHDEPFPSTVPEVDPFGVHVCELLQVVTLEIHRPD